MTRDEMIAQLESEIKSLESNSLKWQGDEASGRRQGPKGDRNIETNRRRSQVR